MILLHWIPSAREAEVDAVPEVTEFETAVQPLALSDFNQGVDDARAFQPMRSGMTQDYYRGYEYACAIDGLS